MRPISTLPAITAVAFVLVATGTALAEKSKKDGDEISAILGAKTSVVQAIKIAEQETGGRAFEIGLENEKDAPLYEIRTVSKDKLTEITVDPETGTIVKVDNRGLIDKLFDWYDLDSIENLPASSPSLAEVVAVAEQNVGGAAIEADLDDDEENVPTFKVEVVKDNTVQKVLIDATTGTVLAIVTTDDDKDEDD